MICETDIFDILRRRLAKPNILVDRNVEDDVNFCCKSIPALPAMMLRAKMPLQFSTKSLNQEEFTYFHERFEDQYADSKFQKRIPGRFDLSSEWEVASYPDQYTCTTCTPRNTGESRRNRSNELENINIAEFS